MPAKRSPAVKPGPSENSIPLNPRTTHFEFLGAHFMFLGVLGMPIVSLLLQLLQQPSGFPPKAFYTTPIALLLDTINSTTFYTHQAMIVYLGWFLFHAIGYYILPGERIQGTVLRNGKRLTYPINGFASMVAALAGLGILYYFKGLAPFLWVAYNALPLTTAGIIFTLALSTFLYIYSFRSPYILLSTVGNSGYTFYDFWMGRELNPRPFGIDLKYFCELRPGLIGWCTLNICFAVRQYVEVGRITNAMWLVLLFQGYYVFDAVWNEKAILTTMDITTDGFGFMLVNGDLAWVPFNYSHQAYYLIHHPRSLSPLTLFAILSLQLLGLYIFRSANSQKNDFRTNPEGETVKHLKYMETKTGSRLLVSGWWGAARHINYTGE
ncbi:hypothetical protein HDV00_003298 [Rhizophlyctis rosea]|nr:hypothetical protein HDV00_003298 [Rhizophlyctis rosea]